MKGLKVGYIRVSSMDQNIARQLENITLDKIFIDKVSGKDQNRVELKNMLDYVREGDILYVHSMDRLARNLIDLRQIVEILVKKGVCVEFIKENLKFTGEDSPMAMLTLSIMGAFAEFERSLIREQQREGIEAAKKRGVYKRRKRELKLNREEIADIIERISRGERKSDIAKKYGIVRQTLYKYLSIVNKEKYSKEAVAPSTS